MLPNVPVHDIAKDLNITLDQDFKKYFVPFLLGSVVRVNDASRCLLHIVRLPSHNTSAQE